MLLFARQSDGRCSFPVTIMKVEWSHARFFEEDAMEILIYAKLKSLARLTVAGLFGILSLSQTRAEGHEGNSGRIQRLANLSFPASPRTPITACEGQFVPAPGTFREIMGRKNVTRAAWVKALAEQNEWEQQDLYFDTFNNEVGRKLRAMIVQAVSTNRRQIVLRQLREQPVDNFYFMNLKEFIIIAPDEKQTDPNSLLATLPWQCFLNGKQSRFSTRLMNSFYTDGSDVELRQVIINGDQETIRIFNKGSWEGPADAIQDNSILTYEMVVRIPYPDGE
jgi:hypothetical protein